ncbi:hypothetical protein [Sporomusa paucivorans]|uniref:hypothetical protein n=1 Tax=Sporomusa paucivorans TaxID=2376 RepID=UPI003570CF51
MTSNLPRLFLRIEDKYKKKLAYIAKFEGRSLNMQVRQVLKKYITDFEKKNGDIKID